MSLTAIPPRPTSSEPIVLGPGRWVSIRPIEAIDACGLSAFYANLSPYSRRLRFGTGCKGISDRQAAAFAQPGLGFVAALREIGPNDGLIVGHGCLLPNAAESAEIAFAVADELQGRGIGRALMSAAVALGRALRLPELTASLLLDNRPMRRLLTGAGEPFESRGVDLGVEEVALRLCRPADISGMVGAPPPPSEHGSRARHQMKGVTLLRA